VCLGEDDEVSELEAEAQEEGPQVVVGGEDAPRATNSAGAPGRRIWMSTSIGTASSAPSDRRRARNGPAEPPLGRTSPALRVREYGAPHLA
jgi:hypothetical protein